MKLTDTELEQLHKIQPLLFLYANQLNKLIKDFSTVEGFFELDFEDKILIRDSINNDKEWIFEKFVEKYKYDLTKDDIEIVLSWKHQIKGRFFIIRQLKKYAKFLFERDEGNSAYGVYALSNSFDEMFTLPRLVETILLPFKDKIIYDGFTVSQNIYFGATICKSLKSDLGVTEAKHGLITTLPHIADDNMDEKLLQFYAKSEKNRTRYINEISQLTSKDEKLKQFYYREVGKSNTKILSKLLRLAGIKSGYFAIINNMIVASGATTKEIEKNIKSIVPNDRVGYVYIYQLKEKG